MESNQILTLIISVLLHGLLWLFLILYNPNIVVEKKELEKWLAFEEPKIMQADQTKRVEKETRTRMNDMSGIKGLEPQQATQMNSLRSLKDLQQYSQGKDTDTPELKTSSSDIIMNQPARVSNAVREQVQAYLPPELEIGDMAALNADQDLYYTFYRRMAEKTFVYWAQNISASFEKMRRQGQLGPTSKAWVTIVELLLDKDGNVIASQPLQLAGEYEMDSAPSRAFRAAKNFPNPPKDMVEEDGYIRIRYKFVVYYNPAP